MKLSLLSFVSFCLLGIIDTVSAGVDSGHGHHDDGLTHPLDLKPVDEQPSSMLRAQQHRKLDRPDFIIDGTLVFGVASLPEDVPKFTKKFDTYNDEVLLFETNKPVPNEATVECTLACTSDNSGAAGIAFKFGTPPANIEDTTVLLYASGNCPVVHSAKNTAGADNDFYIWALVDADISDNDLTQATITCTLSGSSGGGGDGDKDDTPCCAVRIYRYVRDSTLNLLNGFFGASGEN